MSAGNPVEDIQRGDSDLLDPERRLALAYAGRNRTKLEILWQLDATLGLALRGASQPMVAQMKLAWWRDALLRLDRSSAPAEPMLQAAQAHLLTTMRGADLAGLADGWECLAAAERLTAEDLADYAGHRGAALFRLSAILLRGSDLTGTEAAGGCWALVDLARHVSRVDEQEAALAAARAQANGFPESWPTQLRPLGMLAILARQDAARNILAPAGSPARILRMLAHRLSGR